MNIMNSIADFLKKPQTILFIIGLFLVFTIGGIVTYNSAALLREGDYIFNAVNKKHSLGQYKPDDLVELAELGAPGKHIRITAYSRLKSLMESAADDGVNLKILSAYRSYREQQSLHAYYETNYEGADRFSAEAGHSEHQLGAAIDFGSADQNTNLRQSFANTAEGLWLSDNAWRYGFVLSYPDGKEDVTGYMYEPWHFRFIGVEASDRFRTSGLSLLEYLNLAPQYFDKESLRGELIQVRGSVEVYFVTGNGYKRHIPSPEVFYSYRNEWDRIIFVDPDTSNEIPETKLIRLNADEKVFFTNEDGVKSWISSADEFNKSGYDWGSVSLVNKTEFDFYKIVEDEAAGLNQESSSSANGMNVSSESVLLEVPFAAQAPFGNWEDPRQQNGCEEASAIMAMKWVNRDTILPLDSAMNSIIEISEYEQRVYGEYRDTSAADTISRIFNDHFEYYKVRLAKNIRAKDIIRELKSGNLVVVPANGQKLKNPFFTLPGPIEHMLVIIGYDSKTGEFITNDPGTRHGKNFRYKSQVLEDALQDYPTGFHEPIENINKVMIVVER